MSVEVSVIIPSYNEEKHIEKCLRSLQNQTHRSYEVIVVDDGSSDKTVKIAEKYNPILICQKHRGPAVARNRGAQLARGEIFLFVDADEILASDFIEKIIAPIQTGKAIATFTKQEYVANTDKIIANCWTISQNLPLGKQVREDRPDWSILFNSIRSRDFLQVGGFSDVGYGEDQTVLEKLGKQAVAAPDAVMYHHNPETFKEVFLSAKWIGSGSKFLKKRGFIGIIKMLILPKYGILKAYRYRYPWFVVFKIVFDMGILSGILRKFLFPKKTSM